MMCDETYTVIGVRSDSGFTPIAAFRGRIPDMKLARKNGGLKPALLELRAPDATIALRRAAASEPA